MQNQPSTSKTASEKVAGHDNDGVTYYVERILDKNVSNNGKVKIS